MTVWQVKHHPLMGRSIVTHDPRSWHYPVGLLLDQNVPRRTRTWRRGRAYDQGPTSSCVGQTLKGLLNTAPTTARIRSSVRNAYDAMHIYREAQKFDEWPGVDYEGTSALGACEYLRSVSVIQGYYWCFTLDQVLDCLGQRGAVGIGVQWRSGMWDTDSDGFVHAQGDVVGGHEVELHGIDVKNRFVIGTNSWGTSWGMGGRFRLSWDDLRVLLDGGGDAVTLVSA